MGWDNMFRPSEGDNNPEKRRIPADSPSTMFNALDFFKATQEGRIAEPITADRDKPADNPQPLPDVPPAKQDSPTEAEPDQDASGAPDGAEPARPDPNLDTSNNANQDTDQSQTPETDENLDGDRTLPTDHVGTATDSDTRGTSDEPHSSTAPDRSRVDHEAIDLHAVLQVPEPSRPDRQEAGTNRSETRLDWADVRSDTQIQLGVPSEAGQNQPDSAAGDGSPDSSQRPETAQTIEIAAQDFNKPRTPFAARTDLEPNTLYRLEGRGDFYTDPNGTVNYVETSYGGRAELNPDLMNPRPDATYVVRPDVTGPIDGTEHAHVFRTDDLGRTVYVHTDALSIGDADRSEAVQIRVGKEGGERYDGGHLFGNSFGGGGEYTNLVPMLREINRGGGDTFYTLENQWRDRLRENPPPKITVDIRIHYPDGNSTVPNKLEVKYTVDDGRLEWKVFKND